MKQRYEIVLKEIEYVSEKNYTGTSSDIYVNFIDKDKYEKIKKILEEKHGKDL